MDNQDLRKAGLKVTMPRVTILQHLEAATERHMSAEDLYKSLLEAGEDVGLATVYRVLTQFEQAGILNRNHFEVGRAVYELRDDQHHDHLVCLDCGHVEEFFNPEIEKQQHAVAKAKGFEIADHALSLYAHCTKLKCPYRDAAATPPAPAAGR